MNPAAILSVLVSAPTQEASANLMKFDRQFRAVDEVARKGIQARLGATVDTAAFDVYKARLAEAARRTESRAAFKAQLGADFNNSGFNAFFRVNEKARREAELTHRTISEQLRGTADKFFTGSKGAGEERSFARGTLRGTVGRGAGFLGGGLAGGVLGYVSAEGIKSSIEGTTQMVRQAQILSHFTGLAQQSALEFEAVSTALGVSSRSLGVGFRTLATATNAALTDPTKASTRAFRELGLSQAEVKAHANDLGGLFGVIADRLNKIPPGAERTALAAKLLGRNWQQLAPLIMQGSKGMEEQLKQAKALGVTIGGDPLKNIQKLHEAEINLKLAQEGLSVQFTEHVAPALIKVTMGAIKLAETVRRDLGPVFRDLSPVVKDVGHWLEQNKTAVEDLAIAFVGLKVIRTVGGWFGGLYNDARKVWEVGGKLAGLFREQGAAAASEAAPVNELAAAYERLALAQRETGVGGGAAGVGAGVAGVGAGAAGVGVGAAAPAIAWALPVAAAAIPALGIYQGAQGQRLSGLANRLGTVPGTGGFTGALKGGVESVLPFASGLLGNYGQLSAAQDQLKRLQNNLKGVSSAMQLTHAQLVNYGQVIQRLLRQPDFTAPQRAHLKQLAQDLKPTTVALQRATAAWSATFAGFDTTNGSMSRHFRDQLAQDSQQISRNWTRGTRQWTQQVTALTASAWSQIQQMSAAGVSGVAQDVQSLVAMIDQAQITVTRAGQNWLSAVQGNLAPGLGKALAAAHGHLPSGAGAGGWDITSHARKAAAAHEHWNPFTNSYQVMTSAQASALRDQYIAQYGTTPSSGPSHTRATSTAASVAASVPAATAIPSQSIIAQIQMAQLANKLTAAQNSGNMAAQARALHGELKLEHRWLSADTSKLAEVNRELKNHNLGYARHNQLLQDKLSLLQEIGNVVGQINSTQQAAGVAAGVGATMPKVYYHDHPRHSHQAGTHRSSGGAAPTKGGLTINGGLHVHGNARKPHEIANDLYLQVRPYLMAPS